MQRFKNILCVIGQDEASQLALARAVELAQNNQARLSVVSVLPHITAGIGMPGGGPVSNELQSAMVAAQTVRLETLLTPYRKNLDIPYKLLQGSPFIEVIREVVRNDVDLVIKRAESPDWLERLFSGDDMHLLRKCPCPVWLLKSQTHAPFRRILAAVDVGDNYPSAELDTRHALNHLIMEIAGSLAMSEFAELHVVHAWEAVGESALHHAPFMSRPEEEINAYVEQVQHHHTQRLDALMAEVGDKLGAEAIAYLKPRQHLLKGSARREIPVLAKDLHADCLVMGTVARTGVRGFIMGNTAETILSQIECSVLAIKPPGFVTPVAESG